MELPRDYLLEVLGSLQPTEEGMRATALYIRFFKDEFQAIAAGLAHAVQTGGIHQKLTLFYLINEIIQTERHAEGQMLIAALKGIIRDSFVPAKNAAFAVPSLHQRYLELCDVWRRRGVLDIEEPYSPEEIALRIHELYPQPGQLAAYMQKAADYFASKAKEHVKAP